MTTEEENKLKEEATSQINQRDAAQNTYIDKLSELTSTATAAKEELEKEAAYDKNRQRKVQIANSISDGLSAIANLYATSKGAPSASLGSLTQNQNEKYAKEKERRDALLRENKERIDSLRLGEAKTKMSLADSNYRDAFQQRLANQARNDKLKQINDAKEQQVIANQFQQQRLDIDKEQAAQNKILTQQKIDNDKDIKQQKLDTEMRNRRVFEYSKMQGQPTTVNIDGQNYRIGTKTLANYYSTAFNMIKSDIDKEILALNNQLNRMSKRERNRSNEGDDIKQKVLDFTELKNQARISSLDPRKQYSFVQSYYSISPEAKRSLIQLSQEYENGLSKAENDDAALKDTGQDKDLYADFEINLLK